MENSQISRSVVDLLNQLVHVTDALALMERDETTMAMALAIWLELEERAPAKSAVLPFIKTRGEQCKSESFCAAHCMDIRLPPLPGLLVQVTLYHMFLLISNPALSLRKLCSFFDSTMMAWLGALVPLWHGQVLGHGRTCSNGSPLIRRVGGLWQSRLAMIHTCASGAADLRVHGHTVPHWSGG